MCTYVKTFFHIVHMPDVEKLQISPHLSCGEIEITQHVEKCQIFPHLSCGEIWNYSTCREIPHFCTSVMDIIWNFSTWQIFLHISNLWYLWQISGMPWCCQWSQFLQKSLLPFLWQSAKFSTILSTRLLSCSAAAFSNKLPQQLLSKAIKFESPPKFLWKITLSKIYCKRP